MHLYYTGASPDNLRKAREHAPSHSHGYGWTPSKMTPHDAPYFVDNGAYSGGFDKQEFIRVLEDALDTMPSTPDFVVYPDVVGDAEATRELCREIVRYWTHKEAYLVARFDCYMPVQRGLPIEEQIPFAASMGASGVFVGGPKRWKRAHGEEIVRRARNHSLRAHVGNPGGEDGLVWAYRTGFDSADTTSIFQNGYWHYLDALEDATEETHTGDPDPVEQTTLLESATATDGGEPIDE